MPYKIEWEDSGLMIKWNGKVTASDNIRSNGEMYGDKRFDTLTYQICDFLDAEFTHYTDKEIRIISELELQASNWNKNLKVVHLTKNPVLVKVIKKYEKRMESSGWKFFISDSLEEARKWVGTQDR